MRSSSDSLEQAGQIGPFRVLRVLGKGGMGVVYEAIDTRLDRPCALKAIRPEFVKDARFMTRFRREGQAAVAVQHPGIAQVYNIEAVGPTVLMSLELVRGGSLEDRLKKSGMLGWRESAAIAAEIAHALEAVHRAGFVHRDLKPANVLLTTDGRVKLTDFGLVRRTVDAESVAGVSVDLTKTGDVLGTPQYMAPEQIDGSKGADFRVDVYALGITLYQLVTGELPFRGSAVQLMRAHLFSAAPSIRDVAEDAPLELERLVKRLLAKDPEKRGASAGTIAVELERLALAKEEELTRRRGPPPAVVIGGVAALALAVVGLLVTGLGAKEEATGPAATAAASDDAGPSTLIRRGPPRWYLEMIEQDRPCPPISLAPGVRFGARPFEYVNEKDGSVLVWVENTTNLVIIGRPEAESRDGTPDHLSVSSSETPEFTAFLDGFFIGKYEVTNAQFARFVAETGYVTEAELPAGEPEGGILMPWLMEDGDWKGHAKYKDRPTFFVNDANDYYEASDFEFWPRQKKDPTLHWRNPQGELQPGPAGDEHPVVQVSWNDAVAYGEWAGLVLPTEAQWEFAAGRNDRDERRRHPWGDDLFAPVKEKRLVANLRDETVRKEANDKNVLAGYDDGFRLTAPVGSFPAGATPFGALDMIGNVRELTRDAFIWHAHARFEDARSPPNNPMYHWIDPSSQFSIGTRTLKGTSFVLKAHGRSRVTARDAAHVTYRANDVGFRVCLEVGGR